MLLIIPLFPIPSYPYTLLLFILHTVNTAKLFKKTPLQSNTYRVLHSSGDNFPSEQCRPPLPKVVIRLPQAGLSDERSSNCNRILESPGCASHPAHTFVPSVQLVQISISFLDFNNRVRNESYFSPFQMFLKDSFFISPN